MLLRHRQLAALPALADLLEERLQHGGQRVVDAEEGECLVEPDSDLCRVALVDRPQDHLQMVACVPGGLDADGTEERRCLADPVPLLEPGAQPFDPRYVALGVAALAARRAHRLEDRVPLLPLAKRVRSHARALCKCRDIQPAAHTSPRRCPSTLTICQRATVCTAPPPACRCWQGRKWRSRRRILALAGRGSWSSSTARRSNRWRRSARTSCFALKAV